MKRADDAEICPVPGADSTREVASPQRRRLLCGFQEFKESDPGGAVLEFAMTRNNAPNNSNFSLAWEKSDGSVQSISGRPGRSSDSIRLFDWDSGALAKNRLANQGGLPFAALAFDWIFCDAVIEHAGSAERQYLLLKELNRVARKGVYVTTSNRAHPWEFHTGLPLLHWLPEAWWRRVLKWIGKEPRASGSELNLLGSSDLQELASGLPGNPEFSIGHVRVLGFKAYFFVQIKKAPAADS